MFMNVQQARDFCISFMFLPYLHGGERPCIRMQKCVYSTVLEWCTFGALPRKTVKPSWNPSRLLYTCFSVFRGATEDEMRTLLKQRISKDHKRSKNYPKNQFRSISSMRRGSNPTGHVMLFKQTCDRLRLLWCIWFGVLCGCGVPYKCLSSSSLRWHQVRQWLSDLSLRQRLHWQVHLWVA